MWKDFLYFSRGERRVVAGLLLVALMLLVAIVIRRHAAEPSAQPDDRALTEFRTKAVRADSASRKQRRQPSSPVKRQAAVRPFPFDPNRADSSTLARLGLSPFVVRNVLKYRAKGGRFRTADSFARIYGLSEEDFARLRPYIRIAKNEAPPRRQERPAHTPTPPPERPQTVYPSKYAEGTVIDLNTADTASLKRIPGIGRVRAARIVARRRRLGGFYSVTQLAEIKGLPEGIERWFRVDGRPEKTIRINRWDTERLRQHPYLNFYQAKVIVEHRHKYGRLKSLSQLALYEEFTEADLERLAFYVNFD